MERTSLRCTEFPSTVFRASGACPNAISKVSFRAPRTTRHRLRSETDRSSAERARQTLPRRSSSHLSASRSRDAARGAPSLPSSASSRRLHGTPGTAAGNDERERARAGAEKAPRARRRCARCRRAGVAADVRRMRGIARAATDGAGVWTRPGRGPRCRVEGGGGLPASRGRSSASHFGGAARVLDGLGTVQVLRARSRGSSWASSNRRGSVSANLKHSDSDARSQRASTGQGGHVRVPSLFWCLGGRSFLCVLRGEVQVQKDLGG